jgi:hypothetical protein
LTITEQITNATVEMEPELLVESFLIQWEAITITTQTEQCPKDVPMGPREDFPRHIHVAVSNKANVRRWSGLGKGTTECPPAEHVPMSDAGPSLQSNELIAGRLSQADMFNGHGIPFLTKSSQNG